MPVQLTSSSTCCNNFGIKRRELAPFFIIARNLMMGVLGKVDKSVIQRKLLFQFYNNGFISTSNSEQEEQTNREKYVFYCSVSQIHINL